MKRYTKYAYLAVFAAFYVFLLMQFGNVFIYYDDYGYLSLSYGTNIDVAGAEYSFSELLAFMKGHYFNSNGRLLYMFLYCFVHMLGGIRGVQVFMATACWRWLCCSFSLPDGCWREDLRRKKYRETEQKRRAESFRAG